MNTYSMTVTMQVEVDAYEEADAVDLIDENFGEGEYAACRVTEMKITGIKEGL